MKKILIIGAGGFIGGFIVKEAISKGYDTFAGIRESTSKKYLDDPRIHFAYFDYSDTDKLKEQIKEYAPEGAGWHYIIWNLGATKCANFQDFNTINYQYVKNFVEALTELDLLPERFLYVSSLSALGPYDEENYTPATSKTIPQPNTRYGLSKIKAETFLEMQPQLNWIIFRPTGVYGPHEKDYLMMIKSIDSGFDFGVGYKKQMLTFIYVEDLVNAMFAALEAGVKKKKYIISEPQSYSQSEFRKLVLDQLHKKFVIPVKLPLWMAYVASTVAEKWGAIRLKPSTLNRDKYKIMKQRNWNCDISDAQNDFGFEVQFPLKKGIHLTVEEYKKEKNK